MRARSLSRLERSPAPGPALLFNAILLLCLAWGCLHPAVCRADPVLPALTSAPATPLLPYLDYFLDENGDMDIEEAAAPDHAGQYRPLALRSLPNACGVMWLRFTRGALPEGARPQTRLLDMGESIPGVPVLYEPVSNASLGTMEWREVRPSQRNLILLPEAGPAPVTCYLRLDGLPGIWFAPTLRSPQDAADNWGGLSRLGAILALGVVMLLCILRAFSEKGQWRIWTALYVGAALAQALAGMPESGSGHVNMRQAGALMLPGIALMLLPHVGRHLMDSSGRSRWLDVQLLLLSLPGAALALLPIIPSWLWLSRWLDLWPAGTLLFVPTGLAAWISGAGGSRRFLLGCLLPPAAVGAAIAGLDLGWPANLLASLPLWGVALSALILATGGAVQPQEDRESGRNVRQAAGTPDEGIINLDSPLGPAAAPEPDSGPLDRNLPAADSSATAHDAEGGGETFNLQKLLRRLHDDAARQADARGIGLAWYMPPQLDQCYRGDGRGLAETLEALLENALSATRCGSIHLSVRRVPESGDPGKLLFTVSDSGHGMEGRSASALARACAMAGESGGYVGMECGPNGATVAFTTRLGCLDAWQSPSGDPLVIVLAETASMTRTLAHMLRNMPCRVRQAADFAEALEIQKSDPAILLIAEGAVASPQAGPEVRRFAELAHRAHLPLCKRLAITPDQSQWPALGKAGFTHALEEPVDDESLRATVAGILEKMRELQEEDARQASADHPPAPGTGGRAAAGADDSEAHRTQATQEREPDGQAQPAADHGAGPEAPDGGSGREAGAQLSASPSAGPQGDDGGKVPDEAGASAKSSAAAAVNESSPPALEEAPFSPLPWPGEAAAANAASAGASAEMALHLPEMDWSDRTPQEALPQASPGQDLPVLPGDGSAPQDAALAGSAGGISSAVLDMPHERPSPGPDAAQDEIASAAVATDIPEEDSISGQPGAPMPERQASFMDAALAMPQPAAPESGRQGEAGAQAQDSGPAAPASAEAAPGPAAQPARPAAQASQAAIPAAGEKAGTAQGQPEALAPAARPASGLPYVSHHLGQPDEWVGEPMPIGTPISREAPKGAPGGTQAPEKSGAQGLPEPEKKGHAARKPLAYESPSIRQPGEWVGEPMPIGTPLRGHDPAGAGLASAGHEPADAAVPDAANAVADSAQASSGSFLDFIAPPVQTADMGTGASAQREMPPQGSDLPGRQGRAPIQALVTRLAETAMHVVARQERARTERDAGRKAAPGGAASALAQERQPEPAPVPGEGALQKNGPALPADPALARLVQGLDEAMANAGRAFRSGNPAPVAQAASFIASSSEDFGFRVLARMARCVEQAARAGDMGALGDLLPELASAVERNRIALTPREGSGDSPD